MQTKSLETVRDEVMAKSRYNRDYVTTLPAFVEGMVHPLAVNTPDGELALTPSGFRQLVKDRLALQPAIFENAKVSNDTKLRILKEVAFGLDDRQMKVRVNGSQIDAFVSDEYAFFDNRTLVMTLWQMREEGLLPQETAAMTFYISPNGRDMNLRLVSPEIWDFAITERAGVQKLHGNLVISNNELGHGSFQAKVALTRHSCLNSTIGSSVWKVDHRLASYDDFRKALGDSVAHIHSYSKEMADHMRSMQNISVQTPLLIFEKIGEELGIPRYAMAKAQEYWEDEGSGESMYDIVQSVAAGTRAITVPAGRRQPNWDKRQVIEENLWTTAMALHNMHVEGQSVNEWAMTGERGVKEICARYVLGFSGMVEEAEMLASGIRQLEVSLN